MIKPLRKIFKISDITPADYNPRKISKKQRAGLAASLDRFGYLQDIIVNIRGGLNVIVGGHKRLEALGLPPTEQIECTIVNLSPIEEKALNVALNNRHTSGEYDQDGLEKILTELKENWVEFDELNFDDLVGEFDFNLEKGEKPPGDGDKIPPEPEVVVIKLGDLIELGGHRVLCGDSTVDKDIEKLMNGEQCDCLIFDPPYKIEELYNHIPKYETGKLVVFWDFKRFALAPSKAIESGWTPQYEFIWDNVTSWYTPNRPLMRHKACGVFCDDPFFDNEKAIIYDGKKRTAKIVLNTRGKSDYKPLNGAKHISTVEQFQNTKVEGNHAHAKPMGWISAIYNGLSCFSFLDMFGGSGSTLIYCEKENKKSFTIELEPGNCQIIIQRWCDYTEKNTIKINGKEIKWNKYKNNC